MKFRKLGQISNLLIKEKFIMQSNLCCIPGEYFIGISNLYIWKFFTLLQSLNFQISTNPCFYLRIMLFLLCIFCHAFVKCFFISLCISFPTLLYVFLFISFSPSLSFVLSLSLFPLFLSSSLFLSLQLQKFPSYCKSINVFVLVSNAFSNGMNCFSF